MSNAFIVNISLTIVLLPLIVGSLAFFFGKHIGKEGTHTITITGLSVSFILSCILAKIILWGGATPVDQVLYHWASGGSLFDYNFDVGFLIDPLTSVMLLVITFVSLLVHVYSIGYMRTDPGYQRFFSYISFFTFAMLMLVTANNFLQLFFGWEAVGLASYLLIGFWFRKEAATQGSLKAFLVNRVGDFGFLLGIAVLLTLTGSLHYEVIFDQSNALATITVPLFDAWHVKAIDLICCLLFVGAMGKSAQIPLHIWLPESMEGPTPISALIHAATMVTAGIFMVSRMSPLYELSEFTLNMILILGASGALFLGLVGIAMNDIKRIVAYSTLSQLGYMMVGVGSSAYAASLFHLATHACFKAILFLGAGSVILAMHHEQNIQKMGGLKRYMPVTHTTVLIASLALCGLPPFSGFFSKESIIEAVQQSHLWAAPFAHICCVLGTFVTALYTFRSFFMVFYGVPRMEKGLEADLTESPPIITVPLVILSIPAVLMGMLCVHNWLYAVPNLFADSLFILPHHDVLAHLASHFSSVFSMMLHGIVRLPFALTLLGIFVAFVFYYWQPTWAVYLMKLMRPFKKILEIGYGFDCFNELCFVKSSRKLGECFNKFSENKLIDGYAVRGTARLVVWVSRYARLSQTGLLSHYAFSMIAGLLLLTAYLIFNLAA